MRFSPSPAGSGVALSSMRRPWRSTTMGSVRPGFAEIAEVRDGFRREIKSPLILQPGPAALTEGLDALAALIEEWAAVRSARRSA